MNNRTNYKHPSKLSFAVISILKGLSTAIFCLIGLTNSWALPSDKSQALELQADTAEINQTSGLATYIGSVIITQGTLRITANKVIIERENDVVTKITATGTPAHYQQQPDVGKKLVHGSGDTIYYYASKDSIELVKNAELIQEGNTFSSDNIKYDIKQRLVNAEGNDKKSRVTMIIPAKSK